MKLLLLSLHIYKIARKRQTFFSIKKNVFIKYEYPGIAMKKDL